MEENQNVLIRFAKAAFYLLDAPVVFFREKIVEPNQQKYPWYHEKFRRVPTIDECYTDDIVCYTEANLQYHRDRAVDDAIISILRARYEECMLYHGQDDKESCASIWKTFEDANTAWFTKYGDLGTTANAKHVYMKQKHRMVWERRHGPVGSGMKA
ncbi:hypothetical protein KPH14_005772 [Odynerus spinipes]|uniref:NADH dehydrogenase [ubiquinone] 1 beta subcomplex subunit 10 n=1 Tax=Odynerus spinipes TaxID=1348599 RepID=A0AAD9VJ22_9HYME|nr:hypothetical protein KPH14_005772 [Odynerus spinipes]